MTSFAGSDISFTTTVRAQGLRLHDTPAAHVRFHGTSEHESASERTHLPEPVEPGVTYSDIRVDYRLTATTGDPDDEDGKPGQAP